MDDGKKGSKEEIEKGVSSEGEPRVQQSRDGLEELRALLTPELARDFPEIYDFSADVLGMLSGDILSRYTRTQAIEDGSLVDVTATAKEAGFRYPVTLTAAVWAEYVAVPDGVECQDEAGRLWDVLWMCRHGA